MMGSRRRSKVAFIAFVVAVGSIVFVSSFVLTIRNQKSLRGVSMDNSDTYAVIDIEDEQIVVSPEVEPIKTPESIPSDPLKALDSKTSSESAAIQEPQRKEKSSTNAGTETATDGKNSNGVKFLNSSNNQTDTSMPTTDKESIENQEEAKYDSSKTDENLQENSPKSSKNVIDNFEPQGVTRCGCPLCDEISLKQTIKGIQCGQRIDFLIDRHNVEEEEACITSSDPSYPVIPCGPECNPKICNEMVEKPKPFKPDLSNITDSHEPFTRYDGVAIVSKTFSLEDHGVQDVKRMICLMNAAYNRHVNYDFVIYIGLPFSKSQETELQNHAYPAKLTLVQEPSLEEHLANMTTDEIDFLNKRCNVVDGENITWMHYCTEEDSDHINNLAYSWQAEFRAAHIYTHPALMDYKYMIWLDTDSRITKDWEKDPIQAMVENDLVILFDAYDYGFTSNPKIKEKMEYAYNASVCRVNMNVEKGHLVAEMCKEGGRPIVRQIGGFNHITNLDVYRKAIHQKFLLNFVGDYKFSRKWDDQLGVTLPAVFESPERSWDARGNGFNFGIAHHKKLDGKEPWMANNVATKRFPIFWAATVAPQWDAGRMMCDIFV
jgi:hypothetical protein